MLGIVVMPATQNASNRIMHYYLKWFMHYPQATIIIVVDS